MIGEHRLLDARLIMASLLLSVVAPRHFPSVMDAGASMCFGAVTATNRCTRSVTTLYHGFVDTPPSVRPPATFLTAGQCSVSFRGTTMQTREPQTGHVCWNPGFATALAHAAWQRGETWQRCGFSHRPQSVQAKAAKPSIKQRRRLRTSRPLCGFAMGKSNEETRCESPPAAHWGKTADSTSDGMSRWLENNEDFAVGLLERTSDEGQSSTASSEPPATTEESWVYVDNSANSEADSNGRGSGSGTAGQNGSSN
ncbi:hypothetical protein PCL_09820 [Purpureocillium lilacinum]|uniref:Uncharacterized protein n=1 Tax=Purpureocillium lilacinum TaxID=33203 RepID=A0A2U3EE61_PURLI|nr:hypothetical protein PCL_09820 [Purpureocillium lilacinum]